ncbi:acyltransferase family protein [Shimia haliotis]|uniref:Peptidoglycan/LPS O-acetylase OafA/YrhL, contains acyltransferase and SGNH-hydrolase domains n=1 Tax=Shimia haliotis TaxID=1280847 RepID=A0A1I4G2N1_9RHOB|nr:acyltransferase family protein [Shimia haliotis]SFL23953.1 Peptidoglycan/LPS O-acetylase OafA/YrhL, contains acyltransferase and SGNH-hydrolase domains [Shimia haliotis]
MNYRNDIDGLRAVAILGVVLYHAGLKKMSGGYAGVDVFFVISGFLIGGRIFLDLEKDRFSFKDFYFRRVRRILPALVAMVLVTMIVGWVTLIPHDYRYLGGGAVTALLSLSNIWFLNRIDYFNPDATLDPLIHTWSLGIEEQFYAIIPLLLFLLWRVSKKAVLPALLLITLASFATALATAQEYRLEAFYLLHTRAWELLIGVLVAWSVRNRPLASPWHTPTYIAGLILIVFGLWSVPPNVPWPGVWTLPAVCGAAMVLFAPQAASPVTAILANPLMRFVGLISYSLYLWHQPIFGILKKAYLWPQTIAGLLLVCAALIVTATLSWRFIEQPFRTGAGWNRPQKATFWAAVAGIWIIAIGGGITEGYPKRMPTEVSETLAVRESYSPTYRRCLLVRNKVAAYDFNDACTFGDLSQEPTVALLGDSHAGRIAQPLGDALKKHGKAMVELTLSSCLPVAGLINDGQSRATQCPAFNARVLEYLSEKPEITQVILYANWVSYAFETFGPNMFGIDPSSTTIPSFPVNGPKPASSEGREAAFISALATQLKTISQHSNVLLVVSTGNLQVDLPRYIANRQWWNTQTTRNFTYPRSIERVRGDALRAIFESAIREAGPLKYEVSLFDLNNLFCTEDACDLVRDGTLLHSDTNHLSLPATKILAAPMARALSVD